MNFIEHKHNRILPRRINNATHIILHATGETNLDAIIRFYCSPGAVCPHYIISYNGDIHAIISEDSIAWHTAYSTAHTELYKLGFSEWSKWRIKSGALEKSAKSDFYAQWHARWPDIDDPRNLCSSKPNFSSIGIEMQSLENPTDKIFTPQQYATLTHLLKSISLRRFINLNKNSVLGHSDVDPISRFNWDPGSKFDWNFVYSSFNELNNNVLSIETK